MRPVHVLTLNPIMPRRPERAGVCVTSTLPADVPGTEKDRQHRMMACRYWMPWGGLLHGPGIRKGRRDER